MINLIPPDLKNATIYARRNTILWHWCLALLFSIVGIIGVVGVGYMYLQNSANSLTAGVQKGNDALKTQKLDETQKQVQDISNSLKLVDQVLQREVLFSKLLAQIGSVLPNGSVLTNLSINKLQGSLDLQTAATDYNTATQIQLNLEDPQNKIFDKADILSIQCNSPSSGVQTSDSQYPCTVQIRAQFAKNNSFSVISPTTASKTP